jgi:RNA 3'-terminal phosphate cyclase (ATP)
MIEPMIQIDGAQGEGGGQILRSALTLSLVTQTPFRIAKIRAGRKRPGLMRQHLTAVEAAAKISNASVDGAEVSSQELTFRPGPVRGGAYEFAVGTAGSTTLVFQTVFPALALAAEPSSLVLEGGTHNPFAPPFDFLARAFLPLIERLGPKATATLERPGFYPAGGGKIRVNIQPARTFENLELLERGAVLSRRAAATVALLPRTIGEREVGVVRSRLGLEAVDAEVIFIRDAAGPGNIVCIDIVSEHVTEVFVGFGEKGVSAEQVGGKAALEASAYLEANVPVGAHLADQLILPLSLGAGGVFRTVPPTAHTRTQCEVVRAFLDVEVGIQPLDDRRYEISVRR